MPLVSYEITIGYVLLGTIENFSALEGDWEFVPNNIANQHFKFPPVRNSSVNDVLKQVSEALPILFQKSITLHCLENGKRTA